MTEHGDPQLPFDLPTLLRCLWRRRWLFAVGYALVLAVAVGGALQLATRTWEAETSLLFIGDEAAKDLSPVLQAPSLQTQLHMVKLRSNLQKAREQLDFTTDLQSFASSCSVDIQRETSLMFIRARAESAQRAADVANTIRDVFLEESLTHRSESATGYAETIQIRLGHVRKSLESVDRRIEELAREHDTIDWDHSSRKTIDDYKATDAAIEDAQVEGTTIDLQLQDLESIIAKLEERVLAEQTADQGGDAITARVRADRLVRQIDEEKNLRENTALVRNLKSEFDRMQALFADGVISQSELDKARGEYEAVLARVDESEQVAAWREEISDLEEIISSGGAAQSASAALLNQVLMKSIDLRLQSAVIADRTAMLETRLETMREHIDVLPAVQREFVALERQANVLEKQKKELLDQLTSAKAIADRTEPDFSILTNARPPELPMHSNRRMIAIAIALLGGIGVTTVIVGWTVIDTRVRTAREVRLLFDLSTMCEVHRVAASAEDDVALRQPFATLAAAVRRSMPEGARLLVTSALGEEGRTTVAAGLATALSEAGETVLLVDASDGSGSRALQEAAGLGVEIVNFPRECDTPVIAATRAASIRECLREAAGSHRYTIIDGPDLLSGEGAMAWCDPIDAALMVIRSGWSRSAPIRIALDRLALCQVRVLGAVLNDVEGWFAQHSGHRHSKKSRYAKRRQTRSQEFDRRYQSNGSSPANPSSGGSDR